MWQHFSVECFYPSSMQCLKTSYEFTPGKHQLFIMGRPCQFFHYIYLFVTHSSYSTGWTRVTCILWRFNVHFYRLKHLLFLDISRFFTPLSSPIKKLINRCKVVNYLMIPFTLVLVISSPFLSVDNNVI